MTKTQIIYTSLFGVIITLSAYIMIMQPKVNASEKYLELQQEKARLIELNQQLETAKAEESDAWWVDEEAKNECIKSFEDMQNKRNKNNIQRDKEITANSGRIEQIEYEMGLIMSRQAQ